MTKIEKAVAIMNSLSGYERYKITTDDKFIEDTKADAGYFPDEFIDLMIIKLYNYTDYFSNLPLPISKQNMDTIRNDKIYVKLY